MKMKTLHEIRQNIINNIHDGLPQADTKEGTFIRDVFINPISDEISSIYSEMKLLEMSQSILTATGGDLDKLAKNYFIDRKLATHSEGKLRFFLKEQPIDDFPETIVITSGTIVSTIPTFFRDQIDFITQNEIVKNRDEIRNLPIYGLNGLRYIEVSAISVEPGESNNVEAGQITQLMNNLSISDYIDSISNPFNFQGGSDQESDDSLALRISLAVSGANIGTKNGYLSYVLKQSGVTGAKVIGANDKEMVRDGGYMMNDNYIPGTGGKVDIYVRGSVNGEQKLEYNIDSLPKNDQGDIFISNNDSQNGFTINLNNYPQPIKNISSITSIPLNEGENAITFKNANEYERERKSDGTILNYCKDVIWDFNIKDNFPDNDPFGLPPIDENELTIKKTRIDNELNDLFDNLANLHSRINWEKESGSGIKFREGDSDSIFDRWIFVDEDGTEKICKLQIKNPLNVDNPNDPFATGRMFIKKAGTIYVRKYVQPDYKLVKYSDPIRPYNETYYPEANSVLAKDYIQWLNPKSDIELGDKLNIVYNYNALIHDIQENIEDVKVLTADVLIKEAKPVPVEIIVKAWCYPDEDYDLIQKTITNNIKTFIETIKDIGGKFDRSDIVTLARRTQGVSSVNVDSVKIRKIDTNNLEDANIIQNKIETQQDEYLEIKPEHLIVEVLRE